MTGKPGLPDLDAFIASGRKGPKSNCRFFAVTTLEQRTAIRARFDQGVHAWQAYMNWLAAQGVDGITVSNITDHYRNGHGDESCHG